MGKLLEAVRAKNGGTLSAEHESFVSAIESAMESLVNSKMEIQEATNSEKMTKAIEAMIGSLPKDKDGRSQTIVETLRNMAETLDRVESASRRKMTDNEKYQLRSMLEKKKDEILAAVNSPTPAAVEFAFNAVRADAQLMTTTNVVTGVELNSGMNVEWDNEMAYIRYPKNFILDIIRSRRRDKVPANKLSREQDTREGSAAITPEGGVKPLVSYTFKDKITPRIKVAAHMEWTEEFEMDFESLFFAIIDLFETDVLRDWHNILLDKVITTASTYVSTSLDGTIADPDIYSVVGASILSIQNLEYEPDVIWMNGADIWGMRLQKDTTGQYIIPPFTVNDNQFAGLRLYTSNAIEPGHALIGDSSTWKEEHSGFITRMGLINDQLIRNEKTIVGEVFSLLYQKDRDQGSWIYVEFDAVKAALQKPATDGEKQ